MNGTESWSHSKSVKAVEWKTGDKVMCELNCEQETVDLYLNGEKLENRAEGLGQGRKWIPSVSMRPSQKLTILRSEYYG